MPRKKQEVMLLSPMIAEEGLPEELTAKLKEENGENLEKEIVGQMAERENIDFLEEEEQEDEKIFNNIKIKEVKYSFSVLTNIGNFENIRTQIEVGAEIENNEDMLPCIDALSRKIKDWGRREYKDIKKKALASQQPIK